MGRTAEAALASRKRAAIEMIRRHERALRRTARRYSLCADDAEDALQRALEILLTKAPTSDQQELIRWMQTVTKHEALAVRRNRERSLGTPVSSGRDEDWVQLIPSERDGPADAAERRERIGRAREALRALKPQELRALTLLAEGYSYAEIRELTGWTYTKVNRCLAEGRQRFKAVLNSIEEGHRCDELAPTLSAFVDGEASSRLTAQLLAHLSECSHCRAKMRAYRAAPRAAAALAPALPAARSLTERLHDLVGGAQSRLPGRTGATEIAVSQFTAAGGTRGSGMALAAKILTACVGTAGGAAACVAAGVVPPVHVGLHSGAGTRVDRVADEPAAHPSEEAAQAVANPAPQPAPDSAANQPANTDPAATPDPPPEPPPTATAEFSPEVSTAPPVSRSSSGGEFGGASSGGGGGGGVAPSIGSAGEFGP